MGTITPRSRGDESQLRWLLLILLTAWTSACASWSSAKPPTPQEFSPRRQIQVWTADRSWRLHGVRFTSDSLVGIPFLEPLGCDSCQIALPLAAVDSIKTGRTEAASIAIVVVPVGLLLLFLAALAASIPST